MVGCVCAIDHIQDHRAESGGYERFVAAYQYIRPCAYPDLRLLLKVCVGACFDDFLFCFIIK